MTIPFTRILLPYDGSEPANAAMSYAIALAKAGAALDIVSVIDERPLISSAAGGVAAGWLKASDPNFGSPENRYTFDPAKGKKLLAEAGFTPEKPLVFKAMISTSGSGQMLPLPMNEFVQQNLKVIVMIRDKLADKVRAVLCTLLSVNK